MKYPSLTLIIVLLSLGQMQAQKLIQAGPMLGYIEYRTAKVWVEVSTKVTDLYITYSSNSQEVVTIKYPKELGKLYNTCTFTLTGLEPNTNHEYTIKAVSVTKEIEIQKGKLTTRKLIHYGSQPEDISFITGSCSYFNEPKYNRSATSYGSDSSIFIIMSKRKVDFMLWLGDNWYTREVDYYSKWGLWYRAHYSRSQPVLQQLLKSMPHYAIWDDHDFGPNNAGSSFIYKDESRDVFRSYWSNPSYGMDGEGVYTQLIYSDAAFFLLDDRAWRSSDEMKDSVKSQPNPDKVMYGQSQLSWLKDALLQNSKATFKIIVTGSQVLNTFSPYDCLYHFPKEYYELINFISDNNINGVIFLTGDRHRSEIVKLERKDKYALYDITVSPLTSHLYTAGGSEENMPTRVKLVENVHNFAQIDITGEKDSRLLKVTYYDSEGTELDSWSVNANDLKDQ